MRRGGGMIMITDHPLRGVLNVIDPHFIIKSPLTLKIGTSMISRLCAFSRGLERKDMGIKPLSSAA
jgi:hypothetical protein